MERACKTCGVVKSLDDFYRWKLSKDGRQIECKACAKRRDQERYADPSTGRAAALARCRRGRFASDPEGARARERQRARAYREANRDSVNATLRAWRATNRERVNALARARWLRNREAEIARVRAWQKANKEMHAAKESRRRARLRSVSDEAYTTAQMAAIMAKLRAQPCLYCGSADQIEVDHVIPITRGGLHHPDNLAPACKSCNTSKGNRLLAEWGGPPRILAGQLRLTA